MNAIQRLMEQRRLEQEASRPEPRLSIYNMPSRYRREGSKHVFEGWRCDKDGRRIQLEHAVFELYDIQRHRIRRDMTTLRWRISHDPIFGSYAGCVMDWVAMKHRGITYVGPEETHGMNVTYPFGSLTFMNGDYVIEFLKTAGKVTTMTVASRFGWSNDEARKVLSKLKKAGRIVSEPYVYVEQGRSGGGRKALSWSLPPG